jgi:hypothetical protein
MRFCCILISKACRAWQIKWNCQQAIFNLEMECSHGKSLEVLSQNLINSLMRLLLNIEFSSGRALLVAEVLYIACFYLFLLVLGFELKAFCFLPFEPHHQHFT